MEVEDIKREAVKEDIPEKYFNDMFRLRRENETYVLRDLENTPLKLKDGINNVAIRRKRRLTDDAVDEPYEAVAETIQEERPFKKIEKDGRHD